MSRLGLTHRGSGPPLLLLHGLGGDRQVFMPVLDRLAQAREVLAVDLPGFGESPPLPLSVPPTAAELAAEVARWLDEIGLDRVHVAGNSLGGRVALELARQGRARSVTGLSPAGFWSRRELRAARVQLQLAHTVALRLAPHAALVFRWPALRTLLLGSLFARPGRVPPAEAAHALVAYARCPGWQPTFTAAISDPAGDPGGELGVPVTLLWGRRDLLLPPRQRLRARDRLPAAQIGLLPGCGHVPMWDNPQLVAHVLLISST